MELTIVCPTHGRAGQVKAFEAFGEDLLLSVAESQVAEYRAAYPDARIDPHPDTVVGICQKKNWLHKKYGSVFMIDDDAKPMIDLMGVTTHKVDPATAVDVIWRLADQADQMGAKFYGFAEEPNPLHFSPMHPFRVTGPIAGGKVGWHASDDLWWPDEVEFSVAEDVWMSALNAYAHRYCLIDMRYCIPTQVGQLGGLSKFRTDSAIWRAADRLKDAFGDAITIKTKSETALYPWRLKVPW